MVSFAVPSRVSFEADSGVRRTGYVTHFEGNRIWIYLKDAKGATLHAQVHLVFRRDGEASLGMAGRVAWSVQDRVSIEVHHPVDRAIVRAWSQDEAADVSDFVRLDRAEVPTAEFYPSVEIVDALSEAAQQSITPTDDIRWSSEAVVALPVSHPNLSESRANAGRHEEDR
ncbi:MAG: hypothetical protein AAF449_11480 [Myxococcota bacterium]